MVALALFVKGETTRRTNRGFLADQFSHLFDIALCLFTPPPTPQLDFPAISAGDEIGDSLRRFRLDPAARGNASDKFAVINRQAPKRGFRDFVFLAELADDLDDFLRFIR